ncbi:hypothetical protein FoTM2_009663 [Fusarium oxysporum f. sp. vasinfectum]|uniref:Uncharacterized protein n=1 Tax=Fusarium oxysporum f. sp. vasinfectum 25433 TaxID=1089449 RepID=X0L5D6_FUSOX|nr:hypothetical protein FOTG_11157 [Fusarium oxysporum f. sp. vasinfectum 25433]KAK2929324.1 hypothetical protein FoTM2_009663 [Fusarium oxysporum f. sp. vasinfectum]
MERGFDSEYFDQGLTAYFSGQVNPDLLQVGFAENEVSPAVKAVLSSPDTMAAPELHRSPSLYDIPPFIAAHIPPQGNVDDIDVNSRENEANPVVKVEPSSPDTMAAPESPRSPSLYDIQPFYAAPSSPRHNRRLKRWSDQSRLDSLHLEPAPSETPSEVPSTVAAPAAISSSSLTAVTSDARLVRLNCPVDIECKSSNSSCGGISVM